MIEISEEECTGCSSCVKECPVKTIELKEKKAKVTGTQCLDCGHCFAVCPVNAVRMNDYNTSDVDEIKVETPHLDSKLFLSSLKSRRSIRKFKELKVENEKIEQIIEAGRYTPTGHNIQDVSYIVVENNIPILENMALKPYKRKYKIGVFLSKFIKLKYDLNKINIGEGFLFHGSQILIITVARKISHGSLAAMSMELMAESLGLGTLYVGLFTQVADKDKKIRKFLNIKKNERIVQCLAIGYPDVKFKRTAPRKEPFIRRM